MNMSFIKILAGLSLFALMACSAGSNRYDVGPLSDQEVLIQGRMFEWNITQPGEDDVLNTADDWHFKNEIVVPVGTRLHLKMQSQDVLHGFFLPSFKFHQRLMPGKGVEKVLEIRKLGNFPFACSEVCGVGHGKMMGTLRVLSQRDYEAWLGRRSVKTAMEPSG